MFCVEDVAGEKTEPYPVAFAPAGEWESFREGDSWIEPGGGGRVGCFVGPDALALLG